jgi:putative membrane protein
MADQTAQSAASLDLSTTLAIERTRASYERTMMPWIRTATSLITFGFSVYKFFQIEAPAGGQKNRLIGPREFVLMLVSIGLVSLIHWPRWNTGGIFGSWERSMAAVLVHWRLWWRL